MTEGMSPPPSLPESQPLDTDEGNFSSSFTEANGPTGQMFRKEPVRQLEKTEYVVGNRFCCPWTDWNSEGVVCDKDFRTPGERK